MKWQCGLSLKKENYTKFKEAVEEIASNQDIKAILKIINIDEQLEMQDINKRLLKELEQLEPFGEKNKAPIFIYKDMEIKSIRALSEGKHLKLTLKNEKLTMDAIGFKLGHLVDEYVIGNKIDVVGLLEINEFNGKEKMQINILDIMKSK